MGLTTGLNIANSGLRTIGIGLNTVATNVAQAEVEGYKRQDLRSADLGGLSGVTAKVVRAGDRFLEHQMRIETARSGEADVNDYYLSRIDAMFGVPGEAGSLDGMLNKFDSSLQAVSVSPDDYVARHQAVGAASELAAGLNAIAEGVQDLRQLAEDSIATAITDINDALVNLDRINRRLANMLPDNPAQSEVLSERDRQIFRLADYMEVQVDERDNGSVTIHTKSGNTLLDGTAVQLSFDHRGNLNAQAAYSTQQDERDVGTVTLEAVNGYSLDLIKNGTLDTGRIGALINMRDNVLVEAQAQLDELAAGLARTMSDEQVAGEAVTIGASEGYDIDLGGLKQGNTINLTYLESGQEKNVTIVRVDNPALLPLSDEVTAENGGTLLGVDFSGGYAAAAAAINSQLAPGVNVAATADGLQFLDDGAVGTSDITGLSSQQTVGSLQSGSMGMPFFMDGNGTQVLYTGSLEGREQKTGFSSRISVNNLLHENNESLIKYDPSGQTGIGDPARPLDLLQRLESATLTFAPKAGIGADEAPYEGSVLDYARLVISDQTDNAANAAQVKRSQEVVVDALGEALHSASGVDIDQELAKLIALQNSYAANARILTAVDEMMQQLLSSV